MMTLSGILVGILLSIFSVGCQRIEDTASGNSVAEWNAKWNNAAIRTCFADSNSSLRNSAESVFQNENPTLGILGFQHWEKAVIRDAIIRNYTKNNTIVHFLGWEDCPVDYYKQGYRLLIFRGNAGNSGSAASHIGQTRIVEGDGGQTFYLERENNDIAAAVVISSESFVNIAAVSKEEVIAAIAVHEFGHIVGLRHEHAHPDAIQDPMCYKLPDGTKQDRTPYVEPLGHTATLRPYDPSSIMGYCHLFAFLRKDPDSAIKSPNLSPRDIEAIRSIYNSSQQTTPSSIIQKSYENARQAQQQNKTPPPTPPKQPNTPTPTSDNQSNQAPFQDTKDSHQNYWNQRFIALGFEVRQCVPETYPYLARVAIRSNAMNGTGFFLLEVCLLPSHRIGSGLWYYDLISNEIKPALIRED